MLFSLLDYECDDESTVSDLHDTLTSIVSSMAASDNLGSWLALVREVLTEDQDNPDPDPIAIKDENEDDKVGWREFEFGGLVHHLGWIHPAEFEPPQRPVCFLP